MKRAAILVSLLLALQQCLLCQGQNYSEGLRLLRTKLNPDTYSVDIRPILDLNSSVVVDVSFLPVSIVGVNDVSQSFTCNGFVGLSWYDEILSWNPEEYGNLTKIVPDIRSIWKPRMILMNTLGERDPFEDDFSPLIVKYNGLVSWYPGGLLSTSCDLDVTKYPFDEQTCVISFQAMGYERDQVLLQASMKEMDLSWMTQNKEWLLVKTENIAGPRWPDFDDFTEVEANFTFTMRRRSTSFMFSILMPVVIISFLNILGFVIPVESGEKITYGITVLLAQAVFMTILNGMLPTSSLNLPYVTIYVFSLLVIAAFTVLVSILVVYLHHLDNGPKSNLKEKKDFRWHELVNDSNKMQGASTFSGHFSNSDVTLVTANGLNTTAPSTTSDADHRHRGLCTAVTWQTISKWVNTVSFAMGVIAWFASTLVFSIAVDR